MMLSFCYTAALIPTWALIKTFFLNDNNNQNIAIKLWCQIIKLNEKTHFIY